MRPPVDAEADTESHPSSVDPRAPTAPPTIDYTEPIDADFEWHDVEVALGSFTEPILEVDWDNLRIVKTHDDEGRIELMTEDQVYMLLGLRDEEVRTKMAAPDGRRMDDQSDDNDGAVIHVSDAIPDEMVIAYDKDHPKMDLGIMYPSMKEFRMVVRQFAINEEFDLGTEKSDKKRFRGFCKSSEDCSWRILGSLQDDKSTVKVTVLVDRHDCISSSRVKTVTPSQNWVASKAVSILRDSPNMGAKELQEKLQKEHNITIVYDTVWRGREKVELLYRWKAEVLKTSPRSVVKIEVLEVDGSMYFHRFFCALKSCIDGFLEGCRPYLGIDSIALNGRWNDHLFSTIAVDGHNWMYPLAYGFIASKTENNWTWFMNQLKKAIVNPPLLAVCTDASHRFRECSEECVFKYRAKRMLSPSYE